jgi:hypothetical protein
MQGLDRRIAALERANPKPAHTEQELEAEICAICERLGRPYAGPNLTVEEIRREIRALEAEIKADRLNAGRLE